MTTDPIAPPPMTGLEMCTYIADFVKEQGGPDLDPLKDIWEASPRGELSHVYHQFWEAWAIKNRLVMDIAGVTIRPVPEGRALYDIIWSKKGD